MKLLLWSFHIRDIGPDGLSELGSVPDLKAHLNEVKENTHCSGIWQLTTCNRVEYLLSFDHEPRGLTPSFTDLIPATLTNTADILEHLLNVGSSLDSMVFGENQILGQMKRAYQYAVENHTLDPFLSKLLNLVIFESKQLRSHSELQSFETNVSIVVSRKICSNYHRDNSILLVGCGETHEILARSLVKKGVQNITLVNRTDFRANTLAQELSVKSIPWKDFLDTQLSHYDIVSFATHAGKILLNKERVEKLQPKMVFDLSVPSNVDPNLLTCCKFIGLDKIEENILRDKDKLKKVKTTLKNYIELARKSILVELSHYNLRQVIKENLMKAESLQWEAIESDLTGELSDLSPGQRNALNTWSSKLIKKINHIHLETYKTYLPHSIKDSDSQN